MDSQKVLKRLIEQQDQLNSVEIKLNNLRNHENFSESILVQLVTQMEATVMNVSYLEQRIALLEQQKKDLEAKNEQLRKKRKREERDIAFDLACNELMDNFEMPMTKKPRLDSEYEFQYTGITDYF